MLLQAILNGIIAGCEYGLLAAGLALIYQVRSFFNLAFGAVYLTSAYVANALIVGWGGPTPIGVAVAILWGAGLGVLMEFAIYRPLVRRGASSTILLIASLGLLIAVQNIVALAFGSFTRSFSVGAIELGLLVWGLRVTSIQLVTIGVFVAIAAILWLWMFRSRSGNIVRAVADNPQLSVAFGIDSDRVIMLVFAVGSALAAVAGILAGYNTNIFPAMGFWGILPAVVAIVAGGLGSISGAFLGAMFVGVVQNLAAWFLPTAWTNAIMFVVLLGFLLLRPTGLVGVALPNTRT